MGWEQDPWNVPGGVYAPRRRSAVGRSRDGFRRRGGSGGLRVLWVLAVCLVGYASWGLIFGEHGIIRLRKLAAQETALKAEVAEAQGRVGQLRTKKKNIELLRQERARSYNMARDDEMIYEVQQAGGGAQGGNAPLGDSVAGGPGSGGPGSGEPGDGEGNPDRP